MAKVRMLLLLLMALGADGLAQHVPPSKDARALSVREAQRGQAQQNEVRWGNCSDTAAIGDLGAQPDSKCLASDLIFIRTFKTASTSMASIVKRVGERHALNGVRQKVAGKTEEPFVSTDHFARMKLAHQKFVETHRPLVFVSMVRHPVERWLSHYYWKKSKGAEEGDILNFLKGVDTDFQYNYLKTSNDTEPTINATLDSYLLVGLSERFDETVVMLASLLGLKSWCDVLYTAEKISGASVQVASNSAGEHRHFEKRIPLEEQPEEVRQYLDSEEFEKKISKDRELHRLAKHRLFQMIEDMGKPKFHARLRQYQGVKEASQKRCATAESGHYNEDDCYFNDIGCNHKCLDEYCAANMDSLVIQDL